MSDEAAAPRAKLGGKSVTAGTQGWQCMLVGGRELSRAVTRGSCVCLVLLSAWWHYSEGGWARKLPGLGKAGAELACGHCHRLLSGERHGPARLQYGDLSVGRDQKHAAVFGPHGSHHSHALGHERNDCLLIIETNLKSCGGVFSLLSGLVKFLTRFYSNDCTYIIITSNPVRQVRFASFYGRGP